MSTTIFSFKKLIKIQNLSFRLLEKSTKTKPKYEHYFSLWLHRNDLLQDRFNL